MKKITKEIIIDTIKELIEYFKMKDEDYLVISDAAMVLRSIKKECENIDIVVPVDLFDKICNEFNLVPTPINGFSNHMFLTFEINSKFNIKFSCYMHRGSKYNKSVRGVKFEDINVQLPVSILITKKEESIKSSNINDNALSDIILLEDFCSKVGNNMYSRIIIIEIP